MSTPKRIYFQFRDGSPAATRYSMGCLEQVFRDAFITVDLREEEFEFPFGFPNGTEFLLEVPNGNAEVGELVHV